jgi:hypothetical protein
MILTEETEELGEKLVPAPLCVNPGLRGERLATENLTHGRAI